MKCGMVKDRVERRKKKRFNGEKERRRRQITYRELVPEPRK